jgi:predicted DNA binding CopG/RHH family protein
MTIEPTNPVIPFDEEEAELIASYERGDYVDLDDPEESKRMLQAAKNTFKARKKQVGIRLNQSDVYEIRQRAEHLGMPYQTLISAVLHQYAEGTLFLKDTTKIQSLGIERQTKDLNRSKKEVSRETEPVKSR